MSDRTAAEQEALAAYRAYLASLKIPGEPAQRQARIEAALENARSRPLAAQDSPFGPLYEVELKVLQEALGTHYE